MRRSRRARAPILWRRSLAASHAALAVEQHRVRELNRALAEKSAAAEAARSRAEEALRESERAQSEARTLRDSLAARDATIAQVLHSLRRARRAALCSAARACPDRAGARGALAGRAPSSTAELQTSQSRGTALALENCRPHAASISSLTTKAERSVSELTSLRAELNGMKSQAAVVS